MPFDTGITFAGFPIGDALRMLSGEPPAPAAAEPSLPKKEKKKKGPPRRGDWEPLPPVPPGTLGPSKYQHGTIDTYDSIIFGVQSKSPVGPTEMAAALERAAGSKEALGDIIAQKLIEIAQGKPSTYAPKRRPRPSETLKAIDLIHRITGAQAEVDNLGPAGKQADAFTNLATIAQRIHAERKVPPAIAPARTVDAETVTIK